MDPDKPAEPSDFDRVIAELARRLRDDGKPARSPLAKGIEHPAFVVVLTFILTGVVGGLLGSAWQRGSWVEEQRRLNSQREIDLKYKIVDDMTAAVADATTGAEEVLVLTHWALPRLKAEWNERRQYWQQSSRRWRIASKRLEVNVAAHFKPRIASLFEQIVDERRQWGNDITNLLAGPIQVTEVFQKDGGAALTRVNATVKALQAVTAAMIQEVHDDEEKEWGDGSASQRGLLKWF